MNNKKINEEVIGIIVNVVSWFKRMCDHDADMLNAIFQILVSVVCPNMGCGQCIWLLSEKNNSDRDMFCELLRNLAGDVFTAENISRSGHSFSFAPLIHASAVIVNERDTKNFVRTDEFRAIVSGDPILIDRKGKTPIKFQPRMAVVVCSDMLCLENPSESFLRRQRIVQFKESPASQETERIRGYLGKKEVLEYVLYRVLNANRYEIEEMPGINAMGEK